jgi:hypothetical protein
MSLFFEAHYDSIMAVLRRAKVTVTYWDLHAEAKTKLRGGRTPSEQSIKVAAQLKIAPLNSKKRKLEIIRNGCLLISPLALGMIGGDLMKHRDEGNLAYRYGPAALVSLVPSLVGFYLDSRIALITDEIQIIEEAASKAIEQMVLTTSSDEDSE